MVGPYREKLWPRPEYADLGPEASVSTFRPRSQFFAIRTSQPVNNIYVFVEINLTFLKCVVYLEGVTSFRATQ